MWKKMTEFLKFANLKTVGEVKAGVTSKEAQETIAKVLLSVCSGSVRTRCASFSKAV